MERGPNAYELWVQRIYGLSRAEWVAVALVAVAIVCVNKLVIHDAGSTWPGLFVVSSSMGLAAVHVWRRLTRRSRPTGEPTGEPNQSGRG